MAAAWRVAAAYGSEMNIGSMASTTRIGVSVTIVTSPSQAWRKSRHHRQQAAKASKANNLRHGEGGEMTASIVSTAYQRRSWRKRIIGSVAAASMSS